MARGELPRGGERVLDYGCGSGILAIAAAKLGAGEVVGTDIDPQAIRASRANAQRNGVAATFAPPDALPAARRAPFDVVVANILANPLMLLAPALAARVRPGGRIVLSGMLAPQAAAVAAAYARWFNIAVWRSEDGWVALAGVRAADAAATRRMPAAACTAATPHESIAMPEEKFTRCPGCRTVFRVTPRAARDARGPGALRPLQDGVRRRRAARSRSRRRRRTTTTTTTSTRWRSVRPP